MRKISASLLAVVLIFSIFIKDATAMELNGKSFILMECGTGQVLYENNADEQLAIASVTKVMTMLLIMEAIERGEITYDSIVTASERAKSMGGSTIFLDTGEEMSVDDLLKGIAVASGNDACVAMAEHLSGSVESFVAVMNNRAKELGMTNTNFVTCNGLDAEGHYSSARDVAIMSRELLKHEDIFRYTTIWMDSLRDGKFQLANTNKLIRFFTAVFIHLIKLIRHAVKHGKSNIRRREIRLGNIIYSASDRGVIPCSAETAVGRKGCFGFFRKNLIDCGIS